MPDLRIADITDAAGFGLLPPCADPSFDHRTCDYWEDADRGSKAHRASWLAGASPAVAPSPASRPAGNPFAPARGVGGNPFAPASVGFDNPFADVEPTAGNPFAPGPRRPPVNPFGRDADDDSLADNPFAPRRTGPTRVVDGPRKLGLLTRGLAVFGSYAKVLLARDDDAAPERVVAYVQFGPLSAYPRALHLRDLYPKLPQAPLPAVITCVATTAEARGAGYGRRLVEAVCSDLAQRGFAAVEAYPEARARADATSAASPAFWVATGFRVVVDDERFPVVRREL